MANLTYVLMSVFQILRVVGRTSEVNTVNRILNELNMTNKLEHISEAELTRVNDAVYKSKWFDYVFEPWRNSPVGLTEDYSNNPAELIRKKRFLKGMPRPKDEENDDDYDSQVIPGLTTSESMFGVISTMHQPNTAFGLYDTEKLIAILESTTTATGESKTEVTAGTTTTRQQIASTIDTEHPTEPDRFGNPIDNTPTSLGTEIRDTTNNATVPQSNLEQVKSLLASLFDQYDIRIRPKHDQSKAITIRVSFVPLTVIEMNTQAQRLSINGYFKFLWTDELLNWTLQEDNPKVLRIPAKWTWLPKFRINKDVNGKGGIGNLNTDIVFTQYTGLVLWYPEGTYRMLASYPLICVGDNSLVLRKYGYSGLKPRFDEYNTPYCTLNCPI